MEQLWGKARCGCRVDRAWGNREAQIFDKEREQGGLLFCC